MDKIQNLKKLKKSEKLVYKITNILTKQKCPECDRYRIPDNALNCSCGYKYLNTFHTINKNYKNYKTKKENEEKKWTPQELKENRKRALKYIAELVKKNPRMFAGTRLGMKYNGS